MISDSIDIKDAPIVNIGIEFRAVAESFAEKEKVLTAALRKLEEKLALDPPEVGESFYITDIFRHLKDVEGILDVVNAKIIIKSGDNYRNSGLSLRDHMSRDGRVFSLPEDHIWEIKYPSLDIKGILL